MGYGGGGSGGGGGGSGGSYGVESSASPPTAGAFRFNTDSSQLEIYDGNQWTIVLSSPQQQTISPRGIFAGGNNPTTNTIEYITISSTGNGTDFGDMITARGMPSVVSNGHGGL